MSQTLPDTPAAIARLIPHQGRMCLLDAVLACTPPHIRCRASSHRRPDHPLRVDGVLHAPVALEYAAQACALHGALHARPGVQGRPGFLASARGLHLLVPRLDTIDGDLQVEAWHLAGGEREAMYRFELRDAQGRLLVDGRATVVLDTPIATA
ncbi:MAG: hydroxymyristoyl-ACP dehydratase [Rubrivivax sp.]